MRWEAGYWGVLLFLGIRRWRVPFPLRFLLFCSFGCSGVLESLAGWDLSILGSCRGGRKNVPGSPTCGRRAAFAGFGMGNYSKAWTLDDEEWDAATSRLHVRDRVGNACLFRGRVRGSRTQSTTNALRTME